MSKRQEIDVRLSTAEDPTLKKRIQSDKHVLIVDDEDSLIRLTQKRLALLGFQSTGFNSPKSALENVRNRTLKYDLAIVDQQMPEMDGLEFSAQLQALTPETEIILTSGARIQLDSGTASQTPPCEILLKPYSKDTLKEKIDAIFSDSQSAS